LCIEVGRLSVRSSIRMFPAVRDVRVSENQSFCAVVAVKPLDKRRLRPSVCVCVGLWLKKSSPLAVRDVLLWCLSLPNEPSTRPHMECS